ncbi:MAG TPA: Wzz/FepE/Etk N-terminal domain-containing protein [Verrucomicrobiae bacterium]
MRSSQKLYERLLVLYPKAHREEYGPLMAQLFRDQSRDAWRASRRWGFVLLWLRVIPDLLKTSILEHLSELKGEKTMAEKISQLARPGPAPLKAFIGVAMLVFILVFMLCAIITFLLPETYASTARIKIGKNTNDSAAARDSSAYDPYFIQTEFEAIQSEVILGRVIDELNLNQVWGRKYGTGSKLKTWDCLALLKARLDLRPIRNTAFIEIRVFSEDRDEAARIANAIAETYRDYRQQESVALIRGGLKALEGRYKEQEEKVRRTQDELEAFRKELRISEADAQASAPIPTLTAEAMSRTQTQLLDESKRATELQHSLERLKVLNAEELKQVLPRTHPDQLLVELLSQKNLAEQKLVLLRKDFSPEHPECSRVQAQLDDLNKKVDQNVNGILAAMAMQLEGTEANVTKTQKAMEDQRQSDLDRAVRTRPYFDKKRELESLLSFKRVLEMKIASEQIDIALPKTTLVEIMDKAVPGVKPVRPNKELNLSLGACAGFVLGSGAAGLTAWWMHRHRRKMPALPAAA